MIRLIHLALKSLFSLGIILLLINVSGLFCTLRNPDIYNEKKTKFNHDITLTEKQIFNVINENIRDRKSFIKKINSTINKGIAHYWLDEGIRKYNLRIPFYENYLLFIAGWIDPEHFRKYEFMDYRKAIERGVGLCSQHAIILSEILDTKGINSKIIGLKGHVVVTSQVDLEKNEWWVADPDYGVLIPHSIEEIEDNPEIISQYYHSHGYTDSTIADLIQIYEKHGNVTVDGRGAKNYSLLNYRIEKAACILKWIIPFLFMLPLLIYYYCKRKH